MPRGSDFQARWSEGAWAEMKIIEALNAEEGLLAVQYGITDGTAFWSSRDMAARDLPQQDAHGKRPDILVFDRTMLGPGEEAQVAEVYGMTDEAADALVRKAVLAIESEFSPYAYMHRLKEYGKELSFTLKDEDYQPLKTWTDHYPVPLGLVQVYFDSSYFLSFASIVAGICAGEIKPKIERNYNKTVYYPPMSRGISFGSFIQPPAISADLILDKYGKHTAYRKTEGGRIGLSTEMRVAIGEMREALKGRLGL